MQVGFVKHHANTYYYSSDGQMQYGEKRIEGNWYYFHPTRGIMATGWTQHHGNIYYYDEEGIMAHGWHDVEGVIYLFDEGNGKYLPGWRKEGEAIYYYVNGQKVTGERKIDGYWYYFDPNIEGAMVTGWSQHHDSEYYYDKDGHMAHGWYKIGEKEYYFGTGTGIYVPGFERENGELYFFEDGEKYTGEKKIDGKWFYFDPQADGRAKVGWHSFSNKRVYYGSDRAMVYGEQKIGGKWYCFRSGSGAMVIGWFNLPGKRVYYGSDGAMVYGTQVIGGRTYYFDTGSGALLNDMAVKAQGYSSATNWLLMVDTRQNKVGVYRGRSGNWNEIYYWPCTSGAASTPTVKGQFTVRGKGLAFGSGYTCWYYTQFYGNYLFHSVLYRPGSQSSLVDGRLGINASHGCVRLSLVNAKWIYDNIPIGTKVVIY